MLQYVHQVTKAVTSPLDANNIHVCMLPPNTTDLLQPMDTAVNNPTKEFIKRQFEQSYSEEVIKQLDRNDKDELEAAEIQPIDMHMQVVKEVGAKWMVEMAEYISDNPQFIVMDLSSQVVANVAV